MYIIHNSTPGFPTHLKELQERESSCCVTSSFVQVDSQWQYYGITPEKRWTWVKKQFMEVKSQGSDLEKLWYLCPDPFPPSGISGLSNWFRSANEARLETVVLKMKHWYCSYQDYTDNVMYRLNWWETVPSNTRYQSKTQKSPFHEPT